MLTSQVEVFAELKFQLTSVVILDTSTTIFAIGDVPPSTGVITCTKVERYM